ncbi:MAG: META domain-containing protein [Microbacterium sp.]
MMGAKTRITRIRVTLAAFGFLAAGVLMAGCAQGTEPGGDETTSPTPSEEQTVEPIDADAEVLGTWTSDEKGSPSLSFAEDATVTGTDGCNGIASTFAIDGDRIVIDEFATTRKACEGVDGWLGGVREVAVEGDTLIVSNAAGDEIGELTRDAG